MDLAYCKLIQSCSKLRPKPLSLSPGTTRTLKFSTRAKISMRHQRTNEKIKFFQESSLRGKLDQINLKIMTRKYFIKKLSPSEIKTYTQPKKRIYDHLAGSQSPLNNFFRPKSLTPIVFSKAKPSKTHKNSELDPILNLITPTRFQYNK